MSEGRYSFLSDAFPKGPEPRTRADILALWEPIRLQQFTETDLARWLIAAANRLREGSFARTFAQWWHAGPTKKGLALTSVEGIPLTKRIDGALPLTIPRPFDCQILSLGLLDEARHLEMPEPESSLREKIIPDLSIALLALLHGHAIRVDYSLDIALTVDCPSSPSGGQRTSLTLLGQLPFGGQIVIATSTLRASEWVDGGDQHLFASRLHTTRKEGRLKLTELEASPPNNSHHSC